MFTLENAQEPKIRSKMGEKMVFLTHFGHDFLNKKVQGTRESRRPSPKFDETYIEKKNCY